MDGGGMKLNAWMPSDVATLPEPEGEALVLSLWDIRASMKISPLKIFGLYHQNARCLKKHITLDLHKGFFGLYILQNLVLHQ